MINFRYYVTGAFHKFLKSTFKYANYCVKLNFREKKGKSTHLRRLNKLLFLHCTPLGWLWVLEQGKKDSIHFNR